MYSKCIVYIDQICLCIKCILKIDNTYIDDNVFLVSTSRCIFVNGIMSVQQISTRS